MSQYEAQLIVEFLHGKDDEYVHHGSGALQAKFEMERFVDHATLDAKKNPLWKPVLDSGAKAGQKRISLDDKTPVQDTKSKLQGSKVVCAWLDGQARRLDFEYGVHDAGRVELARALDVDPDEF